MSRVDTVYLVHHCHTDIGYTHDPAIVWDLQERFLDESIALAARDADLEDDHAFRWTVETTEPLRRWLEHATPAQIEQLLALEAAGRIEVTGMPLNITPLYDADQFAESLRGLDALRERGLTIRHAMNCDVNGQNWPVTDVLLDAGIESLSMALNTHMGGVPPRPEAFWWEAPSGRRLLTLNGFHYMWGWRFGIGRDATSFRDEWWPRLDKHLEDVGYNLSSLLIQTTHPFGDNGSGDPNLGAFVEKWNASGEGPRIIFATPSMWTDAVRRDLEDGIELPIRRGDWTDFWNFGAASSAREIRVNRASRDRLRTADALAAVVPNATLRRSFDRYRDDAWRHLHLFDEHTWGVDTSISAPHGEDTTAQWHHKANQAWQARSLSLLLQRDALASLASRVPRPDPAEPTSRAEADATFSEGDGTESKENHGIVVFNPTPSSRTISGPISHHVLNPRGTAEDQTAGRHFQDHGSMRDGLRDHLDATKGGATHVLPPTEVPGFGYTVVPHDALVKLEDVLESDDSATVETDRFRVTFDLEVGGVTSLFDKTLDHEWVDQGADWPLAGFIHEEVDDHEHEWPRRRLFEGQWAAETIELPSGWQPDWPARRRGPSEVVEHRVFRSPWGVTVVQHLRAPGVDSLVRQRIDVLEDALEVETAWEMTTSTHPEATYLAFPFSVPDPVGRFDVGGQSIEVERDQLPGSCRDFATVQRWVDVSNDALGVTLATPDAPLVQLGGFTFAKHREHADLEDALILGWPTNTYWETNFRASQPGRVRARYRIAPHAGGFDEARSHGIGLDAAFAEPVVQHLGEPTSRTWPDASTSLLQLPDSSSSIQTAHIQPHPSGVEVRLLNASDHPQIATIGSGALRIESAHRATPFGLLEDALEVLDGAVSLDVAPRRMATVVLGLEDG